MIPRLVSLAQAKQHLRIDADVTDHDTDVEMKILQASAILMRHYKRDSIPAEWLLNTSPLTYEIPYDIQAATLLILGELYFNREASNVNALSPAVKALIPRMPTLA